MASYICGQNPLEDLLVKWNEKIVTFWVPSLPLKYFRHKDVRSASQL